MKIVVIGGTGLIGSRLVTNLQNLGHEVIPASPRLGINAVTGEGLKKALLGAKVIVDVSNSPSFEDQAVLDFFTASGKNLIAEAIAAKVSHYVALSVVGADRIIDSGYMRAKAVQEKLILDSSIPYTILRATQFYEFLDSIATASMIENVARLPQALIQPIAACEVSDALTTIAVSPPLNGVTEIGGPVPAPMDEFLRNYLTLKQDPRQVISDANARYFGSHLQTHSLVPDDHARRGKLSLAQWLR